MMLLTPVLPGCLTQALWQDQVWRSGVPTLVLDVTGEQTVVHEGQLEVFAPRSAAEVQVRFLEGDGGELRLRPDPRDGEASGAAALVRLLSDGRCEVVRPRLVVERRHYFGEGIEEQVELELELQPRAGRLATVIDEGEVPPRVLERLTSAAGSRFAFERFDPAGATLAGQCRHRLAAVDLAALLGVAGPVTVGQVMFCDEEGRPSEPRRAPEMMVESAEPGQVVTKLPEHERIRRDLALLTGQTMWVTAFAFGQRHYLRFEVGELWLVFGCERRGERLVHRSRWRVAAPNAGAQEQLLAVMPGAMVRHELAGWRSEELVFTRVPSDGLPVWMKAIATPFTLAFDILFQGGWRLFLPWHESEDGRRGGLRR